MDYDESFGDSNTLLKTRVRIDYSEIGVLKRALLEQAREVAAEHAQLLKDTIVTKAPYDVKETNNIILRDNVIVRRKSYRQFEVVVNVDYAMAQEFGREDGHHGPANGGQGYVRPSINMVWPKFVNAMKELVRRNT